MNTDVLSINLNMSFRLFKQLKRLAPSRVWSKAKNYYCRYRSRRQLLKLSDEHLADIGLTREEMLQEARQPFWR